MYRKVGHVETDRTSPAKQNLNLSPDWQKTCAFGWTCEVCLCTSRGPQNPSIWLTQTYCLQEVSQKCCRRYRILTKRGVENFLGKDLDLFLDHYEIMLVGIHFGQRNWWFCQPYGVHLGKLQRLEKENSSLRTWVWRLGMVSMASQPPQPLLPLENKALWRAYSPLVCLHKAGY